MKNIKFKKGIHIIHFPFLSSGKSPREVMREFRDEYKMRKSAYLTVEYSEIDMPIISIHKKQYE